MTNRMRTLTVMALALAYGMNAWAGDMTAFELIKEANRYVGEQSKDQVVQIRSEKSVGTLTPNIWFIVLYDPDATFHATEVKFGAGKKLDVKRPARLLEFGNSAEKKLDRKKFNIDSDKALTIATSDPLLANLKLKASQFWLERGDDGPVWKVRLWAAKLKNPNDDADIGDIYIQADDGKVTKRDWHIDRVD